ncbi:YqaJ viral recombinase family protein [Pseudorhodoferax sp.]|uniref:YqaJ viral recombinase family protein n=1 Tax=Pseudorhodoferax sp. TaxID=1993553 RepID=UPI002DD678DC|nr:YqaJ viral recombinase family protein [Pseudorhodoferax sp.]
MNITDRTTHDVQQGTGDWLRLRESFATASEAPAAQGVSRYVTRAELLRRKHTGVSPEPDAATLGRFAAGHAAEAKARPLAEGIVGGELYPVTMTAVVDGMALLASLDGLDLMGDICWETKLWNEELAAAVRQGAHALPEHYTVQMDQELLVSGASRCLFTCTDGTPERLVSCWYEADPAKFAALVAGWRQFHADLAVYVPPAAAAAAPVGKAPDTLPALRIEVQGMVTASNLAEFKQTALAAIRSVNRDLKTDADFADADKAVKWCADVEARLKAAKEHALSQTASIDELFKALDDIAAESKAVRLDLDKLVKRRKDEVREQAVTVAAAELARHVRALNAELAPMALRPVPADFAASIKGLRSIASMQDALDTTLAGAKILADGQARGIRANVAAFKAATGDDRALQALFADLGQLVHKAADDFAAVLDQRITKHRADEASREAARQAAEAQRIAAAVQAAAAAPAPVAAPLPVSEPAKPVQALPTHAAPQLVRQVPAPAANEPATLTLGMICERLQFTVRADFLADVLHVSPAKVEGKRPGTYTESQFALICSQLRSHISAMGELYGQDKAA